MTRVANPALNPALEVKGLTVRYAQTLALDGVDLSLPAGRITGLVGMNGAGKSTLLNAISGSVAVQAGSITIDGGPPIRARRLGRLALVPQRDRLDPTFPIDVRHVVMTGRYPHMGITRRAHRRDRERVHEALERVGLADLASRPFGALSGGQRQRVLIARAIAQEAGLLLLDEPFAGVDRTSEERLVSVLADIAQEGACLLVSTHHLDSIESWCDDIVLLNRRIVAHGPAGDVLTPKLLAAALGLVGTEA
ncbi:metal ABC transporter ATP-binding protein [Devriesea agamarum]|uniref:metal ABC transporter ATP-binding protein n=1 Tax=Devriesea agamarum TaxID=472569 RepID=UPI00071CE41E|nr:metal ABC transporter ATP-binding protein [Devriesea agamarum]